MSNTFLAHIADRALNQPLLILPEKLAVIAAILEQRIEIDATSLRAEHDGTLEVAVGDKVIAVPAPQGSRYVGEFLPKDPNNPKAGYKPYRMTEQGVAIVPVHGSLVNRGGFLDALSGITSYEKLQHQLSSATADDDVSSILLDIDSGGGEAIGAFETGDAVRQAAQSKPVYAVANGLCCSAAYAIASGATRIITSRSSLTGSIGTALLHLDRSKQLQDAGIKPTLFTTGKRKGDGSPFFELSDDVKAELRSYVHRVNQNFLNLVASHRGVSAEKLLALEAGVFIGAEALQHGLVDEVGSFEGVLSNLSGRTVRSASKPVKGISMTTETTITQAQLDQAVAAAVTTAKAEATAAAEKVAAEHTAAIKAATEKAAADATTAERERIKAIVTSEDAKGREGSALNLAISGVTLEQAKAGLSGMPKPSAAAPGNSLGLFVDPGTKPSAEGNHGWNDVIAELNKRG